MEVQTGRAVRVSLPMQTTQALGEGAITALSLVQVGIEALAVTSQQAVERVCTWQVLRAPLVPLWAQDIIPPMEVQTGPPVRISLPMQHTQALGEGAITALSLVQVGIEALAVTSQQAVERVCTWQVLRAPLVPLWAQDIIPPMEVQTGPPVRISLPMQHTQALGEGAIVALSLVQVGIKALAVTSQQAVERVSSWQVLRAPLVPLWAQDIIPPMEVQAEAVVRTQIGGSRFLIQYTGSGGGSNNCPFNCVGRSIRVYRRGGSPWCRCPDQTKWNGKFCDPNATL